MIEPIEKPKDLIPKVNSSERKIELQSKLDNLYNKEGAINSQEVISKNNTKEMKGKVVQELFKVLKTFGVDPSNLESINAFLSKLEQENPDLLRMFEIAFNDLLQEPGEQDNSLQVENINSIPQQPSTGQPQPPMGLPVGQPESLQQIPQKAGNGGLMNKYKNLGKEAMMPR